MPVYYILNPIDDGETRYPHYCSDTRLNSVSPFAWSLLLASLLFGLIAIGYFFF